MMQFLSAIETFPPATVSATIPLHLPGAEFEVESVVSNFTPFADKGPRTLNWAGEPLRILNRSVVFGYSVSPYVEVVASPRNTYGLLHSYNSIGRVATPAANVSGGLPVVSMSWTVLSS